MRGCVGAAGCVGVAVTSVTPADIIHLNLCENDVLSPSRDAVDF